MSAEPAVTDQTSQPLKAALWMIGAIIAFSSLAVSGRALADELSTFEILFYRSLIGFVMVIAVGAAMGRLHEINSDRLGTHVARNICHFAGQNLWLYALAFIPLSQLFALEFTSPLWVTLFAPFLLGERLTSFRLLTLALGFVGVLIVARPGILEVNIGTLTAALSAIGFAGSIVLTKRLTRTASTLCILFWLCGSTVWSKRWTPRTRLPKGQRSVSRC
ncbi:MAG: DMT family transporter [Pseudomonadota bacterium]